MADAEKTQHWFNTIPGILTGVAAFLTALTGLLLALHQIGWFTPKTPPAEKTELKKDGDPYKLGIFPNHEIDSIIRAAQSQFNSAKTKTRMSIPGAEWHDKI